MLVHFSKYHGTGNDFVMVDGRKMKFPGHNPSLIMQLCHRRYGIGADGLIVLESSESHDFSMRYYNADGKEGSMCGNGGRCIATFAHQLGIVATETLFEGIDGIHHAFEWGGLFTDMVDIRASRWSQFAGEGKVAGLENFGKIAFAHKLSLCSQCDPIGSSTVVAVPMGMAVPTILSMLIQSLAI